MLAKLRVDRDSDWEQYLPFALFHYHVTPQASTKESPFFLMYGRDPRLPTEMAFSQLRNLNTIDLDDFKTVMLDGLAKAWNVAK